MIRERGVHGISIVNPSSVSDIFDVNRELQEHSARFAG
jgi:hypothetical protein